MTKLEKFCAEKEISYEIEAPLSKISTFRIGGNADILIHPTTVEQISGIMKICQNENIRMLTVGRGSNVLFSDGGYRGAVLRLAKNFSDIRLVSEREIFCGAGTSLTEVCKFALEKGLSGLEFAYGIPGSVGGAVRMNAGAYGGEIRDVIVRAKHLCADGREEEYSGEQLGMSYRRSVYSEGSKIITGAVFGLRAENREVIRGKMEDFLGRRREKQPLEFASAGSTFKRPEGAYAGELIEGCGLKGMSVGGAEVSEKHAGFVINKGGATSAEVQELIGLVQDRVGRETGYRLECEIEIIPEK